MYEWKCYCSWQMPPNVTGMDVNKGCNEKQNNFKLVTRGFVHIGKNIKSC